MKGAYKYSFYPFPTPYYSRWRGIGQQRGGAEPYFQQVIKNLLQNVYYLK